MAKNYKNRNEDKPKNATIKNKDGEAVTWNENVADRWMEYFEDFLTVGQTADTIEKLQLIMNKWD